jgi:hypothetical protein
MLEDGRQFDHVGSGEEGMVFPEQSTDEVDRVVNLVERRKLDLSSAIVA